jgi:hypothetical protein
VTDPERDPDSDRDREGDVGHDLDRPPGDAFADRPAADVDDMDGVDVGDAGGAPTVSCTRCDRTWTLAFELDELRAGNRALEQFALDHHRHTGHYPDDLTPWVAACRRCPAGEPFLDERPAQRWAETHARHTRHAVVVEHATATDDESDNGDEGGGNNGSERRVVEPGSE